MSQRDSGYERKERDCYETPEWVTEALIPHLPRRPLAVWEPAAASGKIANVFTSAGISICRSDIRDGDDFLRRTNRPNYFVDTIATNPPYSLASEFIRHALSLVADINGMVAMLLRTDFDHAKSRKDIFAGHYAFAKKVVLTKRIRWFEDTRGSPSFNHAWFIWDHDNKSSPTIAYD